MQVPKQALADMAIRLAQAAAKEAAECAHLIQTIEVSRIPDGGSDDPAEAAAANVRRNLLAVAEGMPPHAEQTTIHARLLAMSAATMAEVEGDTLVDQSGALAALGVPAHLLR